MKMKKYAAILAGIAVLAFPALSSAATVTLTASDSDGATTSFNGAGKWSDATAPHSGNDYVNENSGTVRWLRTPNVGGSYTFAGDSLTIKGGGAGFIVKCDNSTFVISNLFLVDGGRMWGGNTGGNTGTVFRGHVTVQNTGVSTGQYIYANQSGYHFYSGISGSADLTLAGASLLWFSGTNDMTGNIIIKDAGTRTFTSTSKNIFTIGANGVNNKIYGTGPAVFNGTFEFNLTGASTTVGDSWTIAGVTSQSFGSSFAVQDFTDHGDGTWTGTANGARYEFSKSTGILTVIPASIDLRFGDTSPANGATGVSKTPVIEAKIINVDSQLNTGSVVMSLDGTTVSHALVQSGSTSTVSYAVSTELADWSVHTAKVVAASTNGTAYTNTWSFTVTGENIVATSGPTHFATLSTDGGWCWYSDPRALFHNDQLYFGYVRTGGKTVLDVFNLVTGEDVNLWISGFTQADDHNVPGLCVKDDGTMLAVYARHLADRYFAYRTSSSTNPVTPADWNAEQTISDSGYAMTYANPFQLTAESGKVYNFCRNYNFNPTVYTSTDGGSSWSAPQQLIAAGESSTVRPYVKYCSDGESRIDFLYTDGHPRDVDNSLYHMYYEGGSFYKTDGTFLKAYANLPINHDSGERGSVIYQYSADAQTDPNEWIPTGRAWCWETATDTNGYPVCVFTVQTGTDSTYTDSRIYYYYARWTGSAWQKRFIAHAGRGLYAAESDYAGGICVDPENPNVVYLSSNSSDPFNSSMTSPALQDHYELWRGVTTNGGLTFAWEAVTTNSTLQNLRPYVPRRNGGEECVLWYQGTYTTYSSWSGSIVGLFTTDVPPPPQKALITYVDASSGASGNTMVWTNSSWETFTPPLNIDPVTDNSWEEEAASGYGNGPTSNWFESNREGTEAEDCPQLRTTVSGLPDRVYDVFAYYWVAYHPGFEIGAALTNNPVGSLPIYSLDSTVVTAAKTTNFTDTVMVTSGNRTLYQVPLGTVTGTTVTVYIDDHANGGYNTSVWYDGIGYRQHLETVPSDVSAGISGGQLTLSWPDSHVGWILQSSTNLVSGVWTDIAESSTNSSWSLSDEDLQGAEYFRLRYPLP